MIKISMQSGYNYADCSKTVLNYLQKIQNQYWNTNRNFLITKKNLNSEVIILVKLILVLCATYATSK